MTSYIDSRERYRNARARSPETHKFALGARVAHRVGVRSEKDVFRVTRQLPNGGAGLQYRIKADRDGQERVVVESALENVS